MTRLTITVITLVVSLGICTCLDADDGESYYLRKLTVKGNRVTKEGYILQFVTLEEGRVYDLDDIIDAINRSKENLNKLGLFSEIFFNDEVDEEGGLTVTIQVKENNYFFFGPTGYLVFQDERFQADSGLYVDYTNLFGRAASVYAELPLYENSGIVLRYHGPKPVQDKKLRLNAELRYIHSLTDGDDYGSFTPGFSYGLRENLSAGLEASVNVQSCTASLIQPFVEIGQKERHTFKKKRWTSVRFSPLLGVNFNDDCFYGADIELLFHQDLLLKIIYNLRVETAVQGGDVPENLTLTADVRGTYPDELYGNKMLSVTNELTVPLPWKESIVIVPFVDTELIGFERLQFLIGGGIGVHLFTRYQNPLVAEIAFGKGVMLNLQKRF
jgi:outer membrane protein assembly factor BamA